MALVCPKCDEEGSSHLASHCTVCKENGAPVLLKMRACFTQPAPAYVAPIASSEELERARRFHLTLDIDDPDEALATARKNGFATF